MSSAALAIIRINESPSLPFGLYVINESKGHVVEFCPQNHLLRWQCGKDIELRVTAQKAERH